MPLVLFPYALGVVGPDLYSKLVVAEAMALVASTVVLYSFDLEGVGWTVGLRGDADRSAISRVLSEVLYSRAVLFIFCAVLSSLAILIVDRRSLGALFWWLLIPLGYVFQPTWLYLGFEENGPLATITLGSRLLTIGAVLLFVRRPTDYMLVPAIMGSFYLLGSLAALVTAMWRFKVRIRFVPLVRVKDVLIHGKEIFLGNASVLLYRDMNVILLGSLGVPGPGVAAYSIAEKIVKAVQAVIRPINQLFLPWALIATKKANGVGPEVFWKLVRLVIPQQLSLLAIVTGTGIVYYASRDWLGIGQRITDISRVETLVTLMLGSVFFGVANNMLGTAGLNHLNERTYYFKALFVSGLTSVLCCIVLITAWGEIGTAVGFVAAEVLLSVLVIKKYFRRAPVSLDGELENREHRIG